LFILFDKQASAPEGKGGRRGQPNVHLTNNKYYLVFKPSSIRDRAVGVGIKLSSTASVQVYEDTSGLTVGDLISRKRLPSSVKLGPGIIGTIIDRIQCPLEHIFCVSGNDYVPKGVDVPNLTMDVRWMFGTNLPT
jgi:vacuolar-type H+-ATPase catalytic subunit A/Vma1